MSEIESVYAWRFAKSDGASHYQMTPQAVGTCYTLPYKADEANDHGGGPENLRSIRSMCYGFHGSVDPLEALDWSTPKSLFVERVLLSGHLDTRHTAMIAASQRTALWRANAQKTVALFAASCAEAALYKISANNTQLAPSRAAIEELRRFVAGELSESELQIRPKRLQQEPRPKRVYIGEPNALELVKGAAYWAARSFDNSGAAAKALRDAAEAIVHATRTWDIATVEGAQANDDAWRKERLSQARTLNLKLFLLMPDGYTEPGWKTQNEAQT